MPNGTISPDEKAELVAAIQSGDIRPNVSAFAKSFAEQHDLNPNTVRSAINRLKKDAPQTMTSAGLSAVLVLTYDDPELIADIGAAALVRYERDKAFKSAVDRKRPEQEENYNAFDRLRNVRSPIERGAFSQSLRRAAESSGDNKR